MPNEMVFKKRPKYAFHCVSCGCSLFPFNRAKRLPDGTEDDMCTSCKDSISYYCNSTYKEYTQGYVSNSVSSLINDSKEES